MSKTAASTPARSAAEPKSEAPRDALFVSRMERLRRVVADLGLAHLLITNPKDVGYLTGFLGGDSYLLLPALTHKAPRPVVITDFRYKDELEEVRPLADIFVRTKSMTEAIGETLGLGAPGTEAQKLGVQAEHMTIAERAAIGRKVGSKRLVDTHGLVPRLRVIKDDGEIACIRKAAKIQEAALEAVLPTIKVGQTESEVAANIEAEMKRRGSSEPGFQTIVAVGAASALPHYRPQQKKISAGKPILIDWGAVYKGYHSDMTRVFCIGKWPAKIADIYKVVLEAQEMAAKALAPGKTTVEIDGIARKHIHAAGFGDFFGHGLGHGIGLGAHEEPRLTNMLNSSRLEAGMVVTIEPGIYFAGVGGVRIEDDYALTDGKGGGAINLCSMKKDLEWATL
jgi:Xaa-Pro aminopeptidase